MRQLEGYLSITPIAIDDTSDLREQVDQLYPGDIALFGTDRLGVPLDYLYIGLDPRDDYSEGRRNSINIFQCCARCKIWLDCPGLGCERYARAV